jgi:chromosome segregation ATPase
MKDWIKRILGSSGEPQINTKLNALDNYVVVNKSELDAILDELKELRTKDPKADARELDLMVAELEHENKLLRARNERLEAEAKPLTDEQIYVIGKELGLKCRLGGNTNIDIDYARAIEAAHGIQ